MCLRNCLRYTTCDIPVILLWNGWLMTVIDFCAYASFIPCVNHLLHEYWDLIHEDGLIWGTVWLNCEAGHTLRGKWHETCDRATRSVAGYVHWRGGPYVPWRVTYTDMHHSLHMHYIDFILCLWAWNLLNCPWIVDFDLVAPIGPSEMVVEIDYYNWRNSLLVDKLVGYNCRYWTV